MHTNTIRRARQPRYEPTRTQSVNSQKDVVLAAFARFRLCKHTSLILVGVSTFNDQR